MELSENKYIIEAMVLVSLNKSGMPENNIIDVMSVFTGLRALASK
jgi:hypothetical protein